MLATVVDSESGITSKYYYDLIDRLCKYEEAGQDYSFIMEYGYNERNQVSYAFETINGNKRSIGITYDKDGRVTSYRKGSVTESYVYDAFGRLTTKSTALDAATRLTETLTYRTNSSGNETGQVNTMSINAPGGYSTYFTYGYDMNGNIAFVKSGDKTTNYTYDSAGQLIREDNQAQGKSWTWVYDNAGNILSKKEYAYTTDTLGVYNPLRYRGYVYDQETSLYYLQSRYYDPNMGRFINADGLATTGQGLIGNNMFAYCLNNPISLCDFGGDNPVALPSWEWIVPVLPLLDGALPVLDGIAIGLMVAGVIDCCTSSSAKTEVKSEAATVENTSSQGIYSVYFLCAANDSSKTIVYVGRVKTANMASRMSYHKSRGRKLVYSIDGLHYDECRAVEQAGMILHHSINRNNPINNQIRGVSPRNRNGSVYFSAGMKFAYSDRYQNTSFLPQSYWDNLTEETFLNGGL